MIRIGALLLAGSVLAACSSANSSQDLDTWRAAASKQLSPRLSRYFEARVPQVVQREPWAADISLTVDDSGSVVSAEVSAPPGQSWIKADLLSALQADGQIPPPPPLVERSGRPATIPIRLRWAPKSAGT